MVQRQECRAAKAGFSVSSFFCRFESGEGIAQVGRLFFYQQAAFVAFEFVLYQGRADAPGGANYNRSSDGDGEFFLQSSATHQAPIIEIGSLTR